MKYICLLLCILLPLNLQAQSRDFTLSTPVQLQESGLLQHMLPRFSLKHGVRITLVDRGGDVVFGDAGVPAFEGLGRVWYVMAREADGPDMFLEWLASDIGLRTVEAFQPDGTPLFARLSETEPDRPQLEFDGNPAAGEPLALRHCGRCHVINETNRMGGMGQTPSFALMRTFADWDIRFSSFYALNPHPSFTQVVGITPPFRPSLPPAIFPLEITQDELDAIMAYVATIAPADLGAPLQNQ